MSEFFERYYPTLCVRRAEMKGAEKLPPSEKQKMLPIVLLAPWLNSIKFQNTFDRIQIALGDIPLIVDLDRAYQSSSMHESRKYFRSLVGNDPNAVDLWIDLINDHANYIPTIQMRNHDEPDIIRQINNFSKLDRGMVFRFDLSVPSEIETVRGIIGTLDLKNTLFVFDGGWTGFKQELQNDLVSYIKDFTDYSDQVKIAVCTSNFPNSFTDLDNMAAVTISARQYYANIKRVYGNYQIFYADWASTKPRRYDGGGSRPLARIDYPLKDRWIISRSKEEEWDFIEAAKRVTRLTEWVDRPPVWGASMIEKTAKNLPGAISTGPQAIAVRVNLHLFVQNNFQLPDLNTVPTDAPWTDPI